MLIDRNAHSALGAVTLLTLFRVIWGESGWAKVLSVHFLTEPKVKLISVDRTSREWVHQLSNELHILSTRLFEWAFGGGVASIYLAALLLLLRIIVFALGHHFHAGSLPLGLAPFFNIYIYFCVFCWVQKFIFDFFSAFFPPAWFVF